MQQIPFLSIYSKLPERFYQRLSPTRFPNLNLIKWNDDLAQELLIDRKKFSDFELASIFSGSKIFSDQNLLAQAYSGHQFGHFNPHLGDGRALLLGELNDRNGKIRDIHLKGSGPTAFSRRGDGKANLAAVIREFLVSESMHALKIPTSRSLAMISTGEIVRRETDQPGAILVRVASSHIRVGTFEHFLARKDFEALKILSDFVIDRHDPDLSKNTEGYLQLFSRIVQRQADLVSKWMSVGFIHGVMNTDNTFLPGETLDYGPCAFMENFDPLAVFSSIDQSGRYAFMRQPEIMQWNLSCLGQCFFELISSDFFQNEIIQSKIDQEKIREQIVELIEGFSKHFLEVHQFAMGKKFGIFTAESTDMEPMQGFLKILHSEKLDYTNSFRRLSLQVDSDGADDSKNSAEMKNWLSQWRLRLKTQGRNPNEVRELMNSVNPAFIPRNHRVEEAIRFAVDKNDFSKFDRLLTVIRKPYSDQPENSDYAVPASGDEIVTATFCNT